MSVPPGQPPSEPPENRDAAPKNRIPDITAQDRDAALDRCIRDIAGGDRDALGALYAETHAAVYALALSMVRDRQDAEDVLQDVYVRIWQSAPSYRAMGKPLAWIFTIAKNLARMELRRRNKTVPVDPEDWRAMFAEDAGVDAEEAQLLASVMELLGEEEREIVLLHAVAGMKHREIAQLLEMELSTVLSKYSRALKKLKKALEEVR